MTRRINAAHAAALAAGALMVLSGCGGSGNAAAAVVAVFTATPGVVLPSTLGAASSLTLAGAAATDSALRLTGLAAVIVLPGVLVYQVFSYSVFRRRVASGRVAA